LPDGPDLVHGTCVALGRQAALLRGASGSGKSDLALRFLFLARRGPAALDPPALVADDQVSIRRDGDRVLVSAPESIQGRIEVRGLGIVGVKLVAEAELALVVDLVGAGQMERLPPGDLMAQIAGVDLPLLRLNPFELSAPIKLALGLARASRR
jgi:HPr kinase/phosphorylase